MIGLSIYIGGSQTALKELQSALSVKDKNCYDARDDRVDYTFFDREESAFQYTPIDGDFQLAIDMYIFGISEYDLESIFIKVSVLGNIIGVPDEESDDPFGFIVYKNGQKEKRFIKEIEDDGKEKIILSSGY